MDLKEKILVALGLSEEEVQLGWQGKSEDGTIFVSTAEELEAGVDISVLTEDGTTILLPIGTYKTEDGISFRVDVEGVVAELIESETEEEDTTEEVSDKPKTITTKEVVEFSAEDELEKLKAENEKLKTELAESPADAPINTNKFSSDRPALNRKQYNKLSKQEKFLYNLNK